MSTNYHVKCPHFGCGWSGLLAPSCDADGVRGAELTDHTVVFQCPNCQQEWWAHVTGDEAVPLYFDEPESVEWPAVDIGVGD